MSKEDEPAYWAIVEIVRKQWPTVRGMKRIPASYILAAEILAVVKTKIVNRELVHLVDEIQDLREEIKCLKNSSTQKSTKTPKTSGAGTA